MEDKDLILEKDTEGEASFAFTIGVHIGELLKRIDELENRIKVLEQKSLGKGELWTITN